ncbi:MAG: NAD(P)-binding domain-containing protein, partial [Cyanobacteriota bacterium]
MAYPPTAFLGLGALGAPMAANLLAAGVPLVVHNRTREREAPLQAAGARVAASPAEAAVAAQVVMLCLSDGAAVEEVLFGAKGAAKALAQAALDANGGAAAPLV